MDRNTVYKVQNYLKYNRIADITSGKSKMQLRAEGKSFTLEEHIQGMIYSQLSAQTVWANIEKNFAAIDKLFFYYNPAKLKKCDYMYFIYGLKGLGCGSRLTNAQMKALHENLATFDLIIKDYGSMDAFVTSRPQIEIVEMLSSNSSKYKLKQIGPALAWEYLRNVGVDGAKPDVHMKRILGSNRLGYSNYENATDTEVFQAIKKLSKETGLWMAEIDYLFWAFCATGKGEICTASPKCNHCVLKSECRHIK